MATADDVDNTSYQVLRDFVDRIVTSGIEHAPLARKLFTKKILSDEKYEAVIDRYTGQTNRERLDMIMLEVQSAVKSDETVLDTFIEILKDLSSKAGATLAKELEIASHKGKYNLSLFFDVLFLIKRLMHILVHWRHISRVNF